MRLSTASTGSRCARLSHLLAPPFSPGAKRTSDSRSLVIICSVVNRFLAMVASLLKSKSLTLTWRCLIASGQPDILRNWKFPLKYHHKLAEFHLEFTSKVYIEIIRNWCGPPEISSPDLSPKPG